MPEQPEPGDAGASGDTIARNAAYTLVAQATTALLTAILTLYLVRALGPGDYGVFALAVGIATLALLPSDFGVSNSTSRFIAEHRGDRGAIADLLASSLRLKLIASGLVSIAMFAAAEPLASAYHQPDLVWPLRGVTLAVFGQSFMLLWGGAFEALGRMSGYLNLVASESAVEFSASLTLVLAGAGATGAAFGRAIGYLFGAAIGMWLIARSVGRGAMAIRSRRAGTHAWRIARYAGALLIVDSAFTLFNQIDVLVIGGALGAASVGFFQAPMRLALLLQYPGVAAASGVAPRIAQGAGQQSNVRAFTSALRYMLIIQAAVVAPMVVWAGPLTHLLLGSDFGRSGEVLRALGPFIFLSGIASLVSQGANYLGQARRRIPIAIGAVSLNLVFDLVFVGKMGIVAGAIGTDLAYVLYVPAHLEICRRTLGFSLRPLLATLIRSLAAMAAMAAVLLAFGTDDLSVLDWVGGTIAAFAAFGLVLVLTREVSRDELVELWRKARRLGRSG